MRMRTRILVPGGKAWARLSRAHSLPDGLPDRAPVTIVSADPPHCTVADAAGRIFHLHWMQLDARCRQLVESGKGQKGSWLKARIYECIKELNGSDAKSPTVDQVLAKLPEAARKSLTNS